MFDLVDIDGGFMGTQNGGPWPTLKFGPPNISDVDMGYSKCV